MQGGRKGGSVLCSSFLSSFPSTSTAISKPSFLDDPTVCAGADYGGNFLLRESYAGAAL